MPGGPVRRCRLRRQVLLHSRDVTPTDAPQLPSQYSPGDVESRRYEAWVSAGYFTPDPDSTAPPFTIVIPPPNVTGSLHIGHALNNTLQDVLIRFKRMRGKAALWLPGTD